MAKGNRVRANMPCKCKSCSTNKKTSAPLVTKESLLKDYPVRTLHNGDVSRLKELVTLSNNVAGLLKQCIDTDMSVDKGGDVAKQMLSGKIKGPAMQKITSNLYLPLVDMKDVAKKIKGEVETLKQANVISKSQLSQRYDEYIDSLRNLRTLIDLILGPVSKQTLAKIRGDRGARKSKVDEQIIFEKEVDELTKKDKTYLKGVKAKIDKKAEKNLKEAANIISSGKTKLSTKDKK